MSHKKKYLSDYKAIIWDWNGTLLNDADFAVSLMNQILAKRTMPQITLEKYRDIFDFPVIDYYKKVGFDFEKESFEIVGTEFMDLYNKHRFDCNLQKDAIETLEIIKNEKITQVILSARKQKELFEDCKHYKIDHFFDEICGLSDHYAGSKVEIGKNLIKKLQIPANEILVIGDTAHDFEVATALNCNCILVTNGHQSIEKLNLYDCEKIDSLQEFRFNYTINH